MSNEYDELIQQNEQNLYSIQKAKIQHLEKKSMKLELANQQLLSKFGDLEKDFNFNLDVIRERDEEINEMTDKLVQLKEMYQEKQGHCSKLEKQLLAQKEGFHENKGELQDQLSRVRQDLRYQKKSYEDQIKCLLDEIEQHAKEERKVDQLEEEISQKYESQLSQLKNQLTFLKDEVHLKNDQIKELTSRLEEEKAKFEDELSKEQGLLMEQNKILSQELSSLKEKLQASESINKERARELKELDEQFDFYKSQTNEKLYAMQDERDSLSLKLQEMQIEKKQKTKLLKQKNADKLSEIQRDYESRIRKIDQEKQLLQIELEKSSLQEQYIKEKMTELENKLIYERNDLDQRMIQQQRNFEQDKRQLKNQIELKEFQLRQNSSEMEKLSKMIEEQNVALEKAEQKLSELGGENQMLIEELVKMRKGLKGQKVKSSVAEKKVVEHKSPAQKRFLDEQAEVQSYEKLFSEDEGPAFYLSKAQAGSQQLGNINVSRVKYLEQENVGLKSVIDEISRDMETAKNKVLTLQSELNVSRQEVQLCRRKIQSLQEELVEGQRRRIDLEAQVRSQAGREDRSEEQAKEVAALREQLSVQERSNEQLRMEREQLLEITKELNERIREEEDENEEQRRALEEMAREVELLQLEMRKK